MTVKILTGDCRDVLKTLDAESVHAVVTDPPYEFGFMGKKWDSTGVAFDPVTWKETLRVMKPGAFLLAFGGTRTHHRMMCAIEDGGLELCDVLGWIYGSGFPKSKNARFSRVSDRRDFTGWGTALKPAWEPIILAQKPFRGTVDNCLLNHDTGALNIEACRIETGGEELTGGAGGLLSHQRDNKEYPNSREGEASADKRYAGKGGTNFAPKPGRRSNETEGRWPANILHDGSDEVLDIFPREAGAFAPVNGTEPSNQTKAVFGQINRQASNAFHGDSGSAARFFYCPKVGRSERDVGMAGFEKKVMNWSSGDKSPGTFQSDNTDRSARNHHPTVKPVELMRYLVKLITPPHGVVLDCFVGSGSTLRAADIEGFDAIGIELKPEYVEIAKARVDGDMPLFAAPRAGGTGVTPTGDNHGQSEDATPAERQGQEKTEVLVA